MTNNEWGFITLPTHADPEQRAIARLKLSSEMSLEHYNSPLLLTLSGGKDSCVLTELALRAEMRRKPSTLYGASLRGWRIEAYGAASTILYIKVGARVCGT